MRRTNREIHSFLRQKQLCFGFCFALLVTLSAAGIAQDRFVLQDDTPSPSDQIANPTINPNANAESKAKAAQESSRTRLQLNDSDSVQPQPEAERPQPTPESNPQRVRPNVASLGNNQLNLLTRSNFYASPIALSLGAAGATSSARPYFGSAMHRNLLDTPEMFGDLRRPGSSVLFDYYTPATNANDDPIDEGGIDIPSAISFGGMRVSENNVALPQDRIWMSYHHMHNAFQLPGGDVNLDRFLVGFEKTFLDGVASLEFRLPIVGSLDPTDVNGNTAFAGGSFGNLDVILKKVLLATNDRVIATGLRVEVPTGSQWHASDNSLGPAAFTLDPNAVYLTPFVGALCEYDDIWFVNSFLQVDIATGGDRLIANLNNAGPQTFKIDQPPLLQFDIGGGVWLVTPGTNHCGWAVMSELHFATALDDDDSFVVDPSFATPNIFVEDASIRTLLNWTQGLHAQVTDDLSVRCGISVPLLNDRVFDTEAAIQVNQNF